MRHGKKFRKLSRDSAERRELLRTMVTQLIKFERITTTLAKAKEMRRFAERMITYAKRKTPGGQQAALSYIKDRELLPKLFEVLGPRYANRQGGYTRVLQLEEGFKYKYMHPGKNLTGERRKVPRPNPYKQAVIEFVDNPFPPLITETRPRITRPEKLAAAEIVKGLKGLNIEDKPNKHVFSRFKTPTPRFKFPETKAENANGKEKAEAVGN
eukprot:Colp12_sorted_trinity150504_noHs@4707